MERRSVCHDLGLSVSIDDSIKPRPTLGSTSVLRGKYENFCRAPDLGGRSGGSSLRFGESLGETGIDRVRSWDGFPFRLTEDAVFLRNKGV
jgi:hypothetical protein